MDNDELRKIMYEYTAFLLQKRVPYTIGIIGLNRMADEFLTERNKPKPRILDWSLVADGVIINRTDFADISGIIFDKKLQLHWDLKKVRFDTEYWNVWRGGECPFGQPEAVRVELELRDGDIQAGTADDFRWDYIEDMKEVDIVHYRVTGLAEDWSYAE